MRMSSKSKLACIITSINGMIKSLLILACTVMSLVTIIRALGDPNGGGWILFIMLLLSIVIVPLMIIYVLEVVTWVLGLKNIKINTRRSFRFWITSSIFNLFGNLVLFTISLIVYMSDLDSILLLGVIIFGLTSVLSVIQLITVVICRFLDLKH